VLSKFSTKFTSLNNASRAAELALYDLANRLLTHQDYEKIAEATSDDSNSSGISYNEC